MSISKLSLHEQVYLEPSEVERLADCLYFAFRNPRLYLVNEKKEVCNRALMEITELLKLEKKAKS